MVLRIYTPCYFYKLCDAASRNCSAPQRIVVTEVYRPSAPIQLRINITSNNVKLRCNVKDPDEHYSELLPMAELVYEAELMCVSDCEAPLGSILQRRNVSGACDIEFDLLDSNSVYAVLVRAFFPSSPFKSAPLNISFRTLARKYTVEFKGHNMNLYEQSAD